MWFKVIARLLQHQCSSYEELVARIFMALISGFDLSHHREEYKTVNTITGNHFRCSLPPEPRSHLHCPSGSSGPSSHFFFRFPPQLCGSWNPFSALMVINKYKIHLFVIPFYLQNKSDFIFLRASPVWGLWHVCVESEGVVLLCCIVL